MLMTWGLSRNIIQPCSFDPQADGFGSMACAKLAHHLHAMDFHGARADIQFARNGFVAATFSKTIQHFTFA